MRDLAGALDKIHDGMLTSYQAKTGLAREKLVALLDCRKLAQRDRSEAARFRRRGDPRRECNGGFDLSRFPQPAARSGWDAAFDEVHARLNSARPV
jgi:hypothetical protein